MRSTDGSEAECEPGTRIVIHGRIGPQRQVIELLEGSGTFRVEKAEGKFKVVTRLGSVTALGTEFSVKIPSPQDEGESGMKMRRAMLAVAVLVGTVQVDFGGSSYVLVGGENRVFGADQGAAGLSAPQGPNQGQSQGLAVYVLDDIAKPPKEQAVVQSSPTVFDGTSVILKGAGNEVVAFQLMLQSQQKIEGIRVRLAPFDSPVQPSCELFLQFYQKILRGGYGWGGGVGALPWKNKHYPDPLIPLYDPYSPAHGDVAQGFTLDPASGPNQAVWVDVCLPKGFPAGTYKSVISVEAGAVLRKIPVSLQVYNFSLPDQTHCDGYGELYFLDSDEKSFQEDPEGYWALYKRFIQMGHAHRFLPLLRPGMGPIPFAQIVGKDGVKRRVTPYKSVLTLKDQLTWVDFDEWGKYYGEVLDGTLFSRQQGYVGPCENAPPSFFPAPFAELWYGGDRALQYLAANQGSLDEPMRRFFAGSAGNFTRYVQSRKWDKTRFFAYIFDECDGGSDKGAGGGDGGNASAHARIHAMMKDVQDAIDRGAGPGRINLVWTSHSRPGRKIR